jgi:hypothetical protein
MPTEREQLDEYDRRAGIVDWLSLLLGIWPVSCDGGFFIPTCRYCGSQRGTPDGQEFVHADTCAWDRVKKTLDAEKLSQGRHTATERK